MRYFFLKIFNCFLSAHYPDLNNSFSLYPPVKATKVVLFLSRK